MWRPWSNPLLLGLRRALVAQDFATVRKEYERIYSHDPRLLSPTLTSQVLYAIPTKKQHLSYRENSIFASLLLDRLSSSPSPHLTSAHLRHVLWLHARAGNVQTMEQLWQVHRDLVSKDPHCYYPRFWAWVERRDLRNAVAVSKEVYRQGWRYNAPWLDGITRVLLRTKNYELGETIFISRLGLQLKYASTESITGEYQEMLKKLTPPSTKDHRVEALLESFRVKPLIRGLESFEAFSLYLKPYVPRRVFLNAASVLLMRDYYMGKRQYIKAVYVARFAQVLGIAHSRQWLAILTQNHKVFEKLRFSELERILLENFSLPAPFQPEQSEEGEDLESKIELLQNVYARNVKVSEKTWARWADKMVVKGFVKADVAHERKLWWLEKLRQWDAEKYELRKAWLIEKKFVS